MSEQAAINPADLEDVEFTFRASELAALIGWIRGDHDRAAFRRWLRSEGWPPIDVDDLTSVIEHIRSTRPRPGSPASTPPCAGGASLTPLDHPE